MLDEDASKKEIIEAVNSLYEKCHSLEEDIDACIDGMEAMNNSMESMNSLSATLIEAQQLQKENTDQLLNIMHNVNLIDMKNGLS